MNGFCTCGVEFVDGARFCHKCGRPVDGIEPIDALEEKAVTIAAPVAVPPPLPVAAPVTVGFRNPDTVRAALMSVAITFLPASAAGQLSIALFFGGLLVSGLLSVLLFLRRGGRGMSTIEGARQGWISGLFFFGLLFVLSSAKLMFSSTGGLAGLMREGAKAQGTTITPEMAKVLDQPTVLAIGLLMGMAILFVVFTSLASVGGMLGARLFGSGNHNTSEEPGSKLS